MSSLPFRDAAHVLSTDEVLRGGGEMGALMRSVDWNTTAVGPVHTWPQSLRTALSILLETGFPMYIAWGPEFTQFYNDGYRPILGSTKHPAAMGASTRDTFAEIWSIIGPMFDGVMAGVPTTVVDFMLPLDRYGFAEECYFIFSYSPIRQEDGTVGGVLVTVTETTARVLGERRLKTTQALAESTRDARTVTEACAISAQVLSDNTADIPSALLYLVDRDGRAARLEQACGFNADHPLAAPQLTITEDTPWPVATVLQTAAPTVVEVGQHGLMSDGAAISQALVLPIVRHGDSSASGVLIATVSPRLMLDDGYRNFMAMVASQIGTAVASARALEEAQTRADALAQLDLAKTAFFSNVSHEFRTPLTLLLAPTEDAALSGGVLAGDDLDAVYRNAQRLLKLVNTLLDFSRLESGRAQALFEPTDLAALTVDLASAFRSATERAGIELVVDCAPAGEPVFVDRGMWEQVVLNLLSNAFKFTFAGRITVALTWQPGHVQLRVSDTGVGIAAAHLPHVFDRFHRVEHSRGRTQEGSGIGLALVREIVAMHGGEVGAASREGEGTSFTVTLPTGAGHLPPERVADRPATPAVGAGATPYVQEALRWLPAHVSPPARTDSTPSDLSVRVLVADDNADMREYISRMLGERWAVEAVADGHAALLAARRDPPDVIVSDIMMPDLDGFGLVDALRHDERTRAVPIILLSARAGEEARIEGLQAGADDYLVKPFSARELVARVQAQVMRAKLRSVEEAHARRLASIFENAPVGVALLRGRQHVFEYVNRPYLELIGGRPLVGMPVREALPELKGQGVYELLDGVFDSGRPHVGRSLRVLVERGGPEPAEAFFDFVYQPLIEDGVVTGIAVVVFEVTELAASRRDAESANRAKDEFLAMLGHELRNPLAPILTALQLMQLRGVKGADRERAIIERQVKHVVGLVDDLLDVSRIARGKVHLHLEPTDLAEIVAQAIEMTAPAIEERRHSLTVEMAPDLRLDGDRARLAQVVANLLTNAAKYTDEHGSIVVSALREGEEIVLRVTDNGRGIPADVVPRVFDLFVQERQEIERSQGGLGIGLAIVRSLVQAHGGSATAHSTGPGHGSTFTITLPARQLALRPPAVAPPGVVPHRAVAGTRVLIVDDNADAAVLLAHSLRSLGHTTTVAHDGPSALAAAAQFKPAIALLDLGLPVMDGFELGQRLRNDPELHGIVLVALTGYAQAADRERTTAAGFDAHLVKPVDVVRLDRLVRELIKVSAP